MFFEENKKIFILKKLRKLLYISLAPLCTSGFSWKIIKNHFWVTSENSVQKSNILLSFIFALDVGFDLATCKTLLDEKVHLQRYFFPSRLKRKKKIIFSRFIGKKGQILKKIEKKSGAKLKFFKSNLYILGLVEQISLCLNFLSKISYGRKFSSVFS